MVDRPTSSNLKAAWKASDAGFGGSVLISQTTRRWAARRACSNRSADLRKQHLIGDLQQPFHSADAGDARGNRCALPRGFRLDNLHHFWDTEGRAIGCLLEAADERR
jgi:hypothetical protein